MKRILQTIVLALLTLSGLKGQNIEFTAEGPGTVQQGESFQVTFNLGGQPSGFVAPNFNNFETLAGPSTMSSSSYQIINGKMSQSFTLSYTYVLQGNHTGKFTIGPAEAVVKGKKYKSNVITVEVVKGNGSKGNAQSTKSRNAQKEESINTESGGKDIFVAVQVDKKSVYQGEGITATIKIYTRLDLEGFEDVKLPTFNNFYSQDVETPAQIQLQREIVNGTAYNVGVIKKKILFPQRSGELSIEPCQITLIARERVNRPRGIFDDFFGPNYERVRKKLVSQPIRISVKPLPSNAPASFKGAVGSFSINSSVTKTNAKSNDAITYKLTVSGEGNLKLVEAPKIDFPQDFEAYDPKTTDNFKVSSEGVKGSKVFEYLVIPRHAGNFKIPAYAFTYFNTKTKQYTTLTTNEIALNIEKGNESETTGVGSGFSHEDVKYIGKDIRYIKTHDFELYKNGHLFFGSTLFVLIYILSLLSFAIMVYILRNKIKENADIVKTKNKRANKMARKRLQQAAKYLKENKREMFFEEVVKAFWGYVSDKLSIPVSDLSRESAIAELEKHGLEKEIIIQSVDLIDRCEFARYAPSAEASDMNKIYDECVILISKMDQKIK
jgi:hypothetical protein